MTDHLPETAITRLFERELRDGDAVWLSLPGGTPLFKAGETADHLYLLRTGRLAAIRHEEGQESQFLGLIRPGEAVGEMSLIVGAPHSADVVALRDSELFALPRDSFFAAGDRDARMMTELARLMILRSRQTAAKGSVGEPSVFGFIGIGQISVRPVVERIGAAVEALGYSVVVAGAEVMQAPTEWFSNVEHDHDFVLYAAEATDLAWKHLVGRQVDRLFRIARGSRKPTPAMAESYVSEALQGQQLVDLILVQKEDGQAPQGSDEWVNATQPARLFQLREKNAADIQRLARVLTGQSVGLVLSGGGARAYAHVGAIRALHAHNVPIDFVSGVSMGGIIAAGLAMGWDDEEMDRRIRAAFVESSPLDDIAFPLLAMTRGLKVNERLRHHFGDRQISDLWLPFFCLSSNLTTGAYQLHKQGVLWEALRASIALPGIMPPVTIGNNVLVDGAVIKNFPADVMRSMQMGPIVGVDVTSGRSLDAAAMSKAPPLLHWLFSGEWRRGPPIVSLLMRAATVTTGRDLTAAREASDMLILPQVDKVEIRDWKAFDPAVEAGYKATMVALDKLKVPVTDLRRRLSLTELRAESAVAFTALRS